MDTSRDWFNPEWIGYESIIGSHAYGLAHEGSDIDKRGWFLAPTRKILGLQPIPDQKDFTADGEDTVYFELQKFLKLACNANPNILEILWSPQVTHATPLAQELLNIRKIFLSQKLRNTHLGYANEQLNKMRNHPDKPWKHAMHLLRVLMAGISAFEDGEIMVYVPGSYDRHFLKLVRQGKITMEQFDEHKQTLMNRFEAAVKLGNLPPEPDYAKANEFLLDARYQALYIQ